MTKFAKCSLSNSPDQSQGADFRSPQRQPPSLRSVRWLSLWALLLTATCPWNSLSLTAGTPDELPVFNDYWGSTSPASPADAASTTSASPSSDRTATALSQPKSAVNADAGVAAPQTSSENAVEPKSSPAEPESSDEVLPPVGPVQLSVQPESTGESAPVMISESMKTGTPPQQAEAAVITNVADTPEATEPGTTSAPAAVDATDLPPGIPRSVPITAAPAGSGSTSDLEAEIAKAKLEATQAEAAKAEALRTAVALNYCRAAFHRIRKEPTAKVLKEEEEKILNNLNLTQVEDKAVISLYTAVLEEISQVELTEEERTLYEKHHRTAIRRQITWDALAFTTELATAQFGSAIRTGANSWWDYRNKTFQRDTDLLKIEKVEVAGLLKRSNQLLDTFWDMARKKEIPDRWLVRGDDLDALEAAVSEQDPNKRLRILNRMKPYMEAYPPYWYYLSRTQQELGKLTEAIDTYSYLDVIGHGHFRKDDMLATAMANKAAIQDYLGDHRAIASAEKALEYSTDVWEANLIAARILQRNGKFALAEDAILRNLDVKLEQAQSHVFLASLYFHSREEEKIVALLQDPQAVRHLPAPVLLQCAALVGAKRTPPQVMRNILASLSAHPQHRVGRDELTLRVGFAWQLHLASFEVRQAGRLLDDPQVATGNGFYDLKYVARTERTPLQMAAANAAEQDVELVLTYPDQTVVRLQLKGAQPASNGRPHNPLSAPVAMHIASIRVGEQVVALNTSEGDDGPQTIEAAKVVPQSAAGFLSKLSAPGTSTPEDSRLVPNPGDGF